MIGFGIVIPLLPRYAEHFGATPFQIGLIVASYSLMQFFMLSVWGKLSDQFGRKPALLISILGTVAGYLVMGFARSVPIMILARIIDGGAGANMGIAQAYMSDITVSEDRGKAMGQLGAAYGLGFIIGPALGGFVACHYGVASPMFLVAGLSMLNALLVILFLPESLQQKKASSDIQQESSLQKGLWKHVKKEIYIPVLFTFFFFVTGFGLMTTVFALFMYHRYALNEQQTGYIYAMVGLIAIAIEGFLFGMLSKRFGNRMLAATGAFFIGAGFIFLPFTTHVATALIFCAIISIGDSLITPALPSIVSCVTSPLYQGAALGFYQAIGSLGRFLGPLIAGYFLAINIHGPKEHYGRVAFFVASGLLLFSFLCSLKIPKRK